jgi:archaetidylinositol phosphate synthase
MLKSKFGKQLKPISVFTGTLFAKLGIPPNAWTLLTLVFAVPGAYALYRHNLLAGLILFLVSGVIDFIDGAVARATKTASNFGAFLDGVADRYAEFLLYLGLWFYIKNQPSFLLSNAVWIMLLLFGALMPSFIRAYAHHRKVVTDGVALEKMGGLLERSERLDLIYLGMALGCFNAIYITYAIAVVAVLSHLTALQRIRSVAFS